MIENVIEIGKSSLIDLVKKFKDEGFRFITATCVDLKKEFLIYYHFDKDYQMKHLKLTMSKTEELPSISSVYFSSVLVENEMKDFFGLNFTDLAIDYQGKFLITDDVSPKPFGKLEDLSN